MARGAAVAATLATARGPLPARGVAATAAVISPGGVAWDDDGTIVFVGPRRRPPLGAGLARAASTKGRSSPDSSTATSTCRSSAGGRTSSRPASPACRIATSTARRAGSSAPLGCSPRPRTRRCSRSRRASPSRWPRTARPRRAEDRLRAVGRGRAAAAPARAPARRGGAADVLGDAARVPRDPRRVGPARTGSRPRATS